MKCLIDYKIINNNEEIIKNNILSDYSDNVLSYTDDSDSIKLTINKDNIIMIKDNLDSVLTFNFLENEKTEVTYYLKMLNSYLNINILTNKLDISNNKINIEYELWAEDEYMGKFKYSICIKEM